MRSIVIQKKYTDRNEDPSLNNYFKEIEKYEILTPEEEKELAQRTRNGDEKAKEKLINSNLRFVVSVAKHYHNSNCKLTLSDLIEEGNLGLIKAAEDFDPNYNYKFISYAVWWIRQKITLALDSKEKSIRIPSNRRKFYNKIFSFEEKRKNISGNYPSVKETCDYFNIDEGEYWDLFYQFSPISSLESPIGEEEDNRPLKFSIPDSKDLEPNHKILKDDQKIEAQSLLNNLSDLEYKILTQHFGFFDKEPMNMDQISERVNLTRERVRQIKIKAIRKIRNNLKNYDSSPF